MGFDALAKVYGGMEACCAGRLMQRVRTAHLAACPEQGRVLLAGCCWPGKGMDAPWQRCGN